MQENGCTQDQEALEQICRVSFLFDRDLLQVLAIVEQSVAHLLDTDGILLAFGELADVPGRDRASRFLREKKRSIRSSDIVRKSNNFFRHVNHLLDLSYHMGSIP